ncbi:MAG: M28 family peptidase [Bacteroidales bacterium]
MKKLILCLTVILIMIGAPEVSYSQKRIPGTDAISSSDLASYLTFLASPLLKGRKNGEPGLDIAQQYIISEVKLLGLQPANGKSYLQPYSIIKNTINPAKTMIQVVPKGRDTLTIRDPIYQLVPTGPVDFTIDGDVVFAGYGLKQDKYGYNDFDNIQTEGKILLVMMSSPVNKEGKYVFEPMNWKSFMSIQVKLTALLLSRAKAVMFVMDPRSGYLSLEDQFPGISDELTSSTAFKGEKPRNFQFANMPKILFVSRMVADAILDGSGFTLEELQTKIDSDLKPHSFLVPDKQVRITEAVKSVEEPLNNVAAYIEGSDPILKNEYIVFSCHADHIGVSANGINTGADDNASGCAALLSMAKAFQSLDKKPLRSILFLWFSGEELGLFGSQSYVNNPLVPLDKTVVDLNMDMIGRVKSAADTSAENPMTGPNKVFAITDNQSKDLLKIAEDVDKGSDLDLDYSLSGRNHPLQLFARSDHYNFVKHDIPVLFFTTGLHTDYHTPGDVVEKIDFNKMELVTRTMYQIGYDVANSKSRITVDNPFSKW